MSDLIRGTTPNLVYTCTSEDMDLSTLVEIWFTVKQKSSGAEITYMLSKSELLIDTEKKTISASMSQADTLQFKPENVEVQIRAVADDDRAYATDIFTVNMKRIIKGGIIQGGDVGD